MEGTNISQFINPGAASECLLHFQRMRLQREMVDTFIETKEGEVAIAHSMVLTAHFPKLQKLLRGNGVRQLKWRRFSFDVVEAAVNYAYTGIIDVTPQMATKLYLLAHNLRSQIIINWCTEFIKYTITKDNAPEVWLAANATKNEILIGACAPLVTLNWAIFSRNNLIGENTEVFGIKELLKCTQTSGVTSEEKLNLISSWICSSRDEQDCIARIEAIHNLIPLLQIQQKPDIFEELCAGFDKLQLPIESKKLLEQILKESVEQLIASSSSKSESDLANTNQVHLALVELGYGEYNTYVKIVEPKSVAAVAEQKLPDRCCYSVIPFHNKLVFVGGYDENNCKLRKVDSMDPITGCLSSLPDMLLPKCQPHCASNNHQIFVFGDQLSSSSDRFSSEFFDSESNEWLPLPSMIVERCGHAAVDIPHVGVLVVGGRGKDDMDLSSAELLIFGPREGEEWLKWRPIAPMLQECGSPSAVCFRQTVYVLGALDDVNNIQMLNMSMGDFCQWTSLKTFGPCGHDFLVNRVILVGDELLLEAANGDDYAVELEIDPKLQHEKLKQMKHLPNLCTQFILEVVPVRL